MLTSVRLGVCDQLSVSVCVAFPPTTTCVADFDSESPTMFAADHWISELASTIVLNLALSTENPLPLTSYKVMIGHDQRA